MARKKSSPGGKPQKRPPLGLCTRFLDKVTNMPRTLPDGPLCKKAGLPIGQISRWKHPTKPRPIYLWQAFALSRALGVSLDWLADDTQQGIVPPESTPEWVELMGIIRRLGPERAIKRLMGLPEGDPGEPPRTRWLSGEPIEGRATTAGKIPEPAPPKRSRRRRQRDQEGTDRE